MNHTVDAHSITIRARDSRMPESAPHLYCLAYTGAGTPRQPIAYDSRRNMNSYVIEHKLDEPVLLPDVDNLRLADLIHPGMTYQRERVRTKSQLCWRLKGVDHAQLDFTINVEHESFVNLWLCRSALALAGDLIGIEIDGHLRMSRLADRNVVDLVDLYARRGDHEVFREAGAVKSALEQYMPTLKGPQSPQAVELGQAVSRLRTVIGRRGVEKKTQFRRGLRDVIQEAIKHANQRHHASQAGPLGVAIEPETNVAHDHEPHWQFDAWAALQELLESLLFEQLRSLQSLAQGRSGTPSMKVGLRSSAGGRSIDIMNTLEPPSWAVDMARYFFWYVLDDPRRPAPGYKGSGLYLIGSSLRRLGVTPYARPGLPPELRALYGDKYVGLWIELVCR